ncbi:MAG: hypothetical protein JWP10_1027 [Nocardioidaceae bacterium]|nr:hypothetical protein [Nocardioidaceae bacterium]
MTDVHLVWLRPQGGETSSGDSLGTEWLDRIALDSDGLGDLLLGFGFDESYGGIGIAPLNGPEPSSPVGALQRVTCERVHFERAAPSIEVAAFVYRTPAFTREEFAIRYQAIGLRLREFGGPARLMCRYAQYHVVGEIDGPDAVGILGFASADDLRGFLTAPWLMEVLLPYEAEFIDHSRSIQLLVRQRPAH